MTRNCFLAAWAVVIVAALVRSATAEVVVDSAGYREESGVSIRQEETRLRVSWPISESETGVVILQLRPEAPLIEELGIVEADDKRTVVLAGKLNPVLFLTVGERDLSKQGWNAFFDNPPKRPHETHQATLELKSVKLQSRGKRSTVILDGLTAGPFGGDLRFTFYPGCRLVHVDAVVSTQKEACAILYDAGLVSPTANWKSNAWLDTSGKIQRVPANAQDPAAPVAVRHRTIIAESDNGSVAIFPPPHQFLYPLDFADNFKFVWHGRGFQKSPDWGLGVRQPPEGDKRFVPWVNAPPGTQQHLSVFYLLSLGPAEEAIKHVQRFTHGDRFKTLPGYRTFASHFHVEHTLDYLARQREQQTDQVPQGLEAPGFVKAFKDLGVEIVHLAEFHVGHSPDFIAQRLVHLDTLHRECRRLSDKDLLLLPGEEPNVHLGGHWISLFPRPVYWLLHPPADAPFEKKVDGLGSVYAVRSPEDVLQLMEKEQGLMWTAHPRTKSSFGFPDRYREQDFYRSDRFLGAAWKAMPSDLSQPRLGTRSLDLLSDMANWGQQKYVLGEVDVFKVQPDYELYGHMNVNYLKLDKLPRFDDGWPEIVDALRQGRFFVSTGEVLIPKFKVSGKESGETLRLGNDKMVEVIAELEWTFPPAFAEVIWGDGKSVHRQRVGLDDRAAFSGEELQVTVNLRGAKWVRFEAWDVAANGAFTQAVWVE